MRRATRMRRPRALVVMTNQGERASLANQLRRRGIAVQVEPTGFHGAAALAGALLDGASPPDILIVDAVLPGAMGLSLVEGVRANQWTTPIVVLVGDRGGAEVALRAGADRAFSYASAAPEVLRFALSCVRAQRTCTSHAVPRFPVFPCARNTNMVPRPRPRSRGGAA